MRDKILPLMVCCVAVVLFSLIPSVVYGDYQSKGKRDPFVRLMTQDGRRIHPPGLDEEEEADFGAVVLQGIVFDVESDSFAIINGEVLREEDEVNGVKIIKIEPTTVTVLVDGKLHKLTTVQPTEENRE